MTEETPPDTRSKAPSPPYIRRVRIRNYKSIASCDVELGALTVLVGRNGAGKSNFLDALSFVAEALESSVMHALEEPRGFQDVFHKQKDGTASPCFEIRLDLNLPYGEGQYGFVIANHEGRPVVDFEEATVTAGQEMARFVRRGTEVDPPWMGESPRIRDDRLYLFQAANVDAFAWIYDLLVQIRTYRLHPPEMVKPREPKEAQALQADGANIANVIRRLEEEDPNAWERIQLYLQAILPTVSSVRAKDFGPHRILEFKGVEGSQRSFFSTSMSDGTLRALGALVAALNPGEDAKSCPFIGIEEPEVALHPAATEVLLDAFREAAERNQVLITTHSSELLDLIDLDSETLLVAAAPEGDTRIGPVNSVSLGAIRDHLFSAGDLLRMDHLVPERSKAEAEEIPAGGEVE